MALNDVEHCDVHHCHSNIVLKVHRELPSEDELYDLAELFKVFGDSTRIKILFALFESEMCVCDIAEALNMEQSAVSHQLRILRDARLVRFRKEGKEAWYTLDDEHVVKLMAQGMEHIMHL